jgi:GntR family transcriptional regulator/MocR family aminotransferase
VLSAERRAAVLRWALERRALVIEDDHDAEYRYDRAPIGALQGLAPDLAAYSGTASKTLAPGLARPAPPNSSTTSPPPSSSPIAARPSSISWPSPTSWTAVSSIATCAGCVRSIGAVATRCSQPCADTPTSSSRPGSRRGVAYLPRGLDETAVAEAAARRGVTVYGLTPYRLSGEGRPGLNFGYATLGEGAIAEGIEILAEAISDVRSG